MFISTVKAINNNNNKYGKRTCLINTEKMIVGVFLLCTVSSTVLSQDVINCHDLAKSIITENGPEAANYYWFPRCLTGGYYENVQCDYYGCYCAYLDTGLQIPDTPEKFLASYMKDICPWLSKDTPNLCTKPPPDYPCRNTSKRYYFSSVTEKCELSESSCLGFETEEACSTACVVQKRNRCNFRVAKGKACDRRKPGERWYHDEEKGICRPFFYEGCGGNSNNYREKWICLKSCEKSQLTDLILQVHNTKYIVSLPTWLVVQLLLVPSTTNEISTDKFKEISEYMVEISRFNVEGEKREGQEQEEEEREKYRPKHAPKNMTREKICSMESDTGPCRAYMRRWYFNKKQSKCVLFIYGGCYGNENRHDTAEGCAIFCDAQIKPTETDKIGGFMGGGGLLGGDLLKILGASEKNGKPKKPSDGARSLGLGGPPSFPPPPPTKTPETKPTEVGIIGENALEIVFD